MTFQCLRRSRKNRQVVYKLCGPAARNDPLLKQALFFYFLFDFCPRSVPTVVGSYSINRLFFSLETSTVLVPTVDLLQ